MQGWGPGREGGGAAFLRSVGSVYLDQSFPVVATASFIYILLYIYITL